MYILEWIEQDRGRQRGMLGLNLAAGLGRSVPSTVRPRK